MSISYLSICAIASLLAWFWLLLARGGYWRCDQLLKEDKTIIDKWPKIVAVIPARDEAETIETAVNSLLQQNYEGELHVVVVDDNSSDGTADIVESITDDRVSLIQGQPLEQGWTGKMWAVSQGAAYAENEFSKPPYLLLTDADIAHGEGVLHDLVSKAEREELDLVSLMVLLRCSTAWEKLLIPPFVYFFQKLFPFPWVNDRRRKAAAAAGGCMLVRSSALQRVGGISRIRDRVIDDCALATAIKPGGPIWLGLAEKSRSLRGYDQLAGIWDMVARTAFVQLRRSILLVTLSTVGMLFLYLVPPVAFVAGLWFGDLPATVFGAAGWAIMTVSIIPTLWLYGLPAVCGILLPLAGLFYTSMTVSSALRDKRGKGGAWKGRHY
ncbi:MAG: glycosyl transferase family 2 [Rhodospirillaceae bacterium]|nr:glycosyl transferase family 2 [Rhodospirillaceae bacterium]